MALTSQQFAEVVMTLRAASEPSPGQELRTATRIEVNSKVLVWLLGRDGKPLEGRTVLARDISLGGIGLLGAVPVQGGERFIAGLPRGRAKPILVRCTSRHCRELADGVYAVGALYETVSEAAAAAS